MQSSQVLTEYREFLVGKMVERHRLTRQAAEAVVEGRCCCVSGRVIGRDELCFVDLSGRGIELALWDAAGRFKECDAEIIDPQDTQYSSRVRRFVRKLAATSPDYRSIVSVPSNGASQASDSEEKKRRKGVARRPRRSVISRMPRRRPWRPVSR